MEGQNGSLQNEDIFQKKRSYCTSMIVQGRVFSDFILKLKKSAERSDLGIDMHMHVQIRYIAIHHISIKISRSSPYKIPIDSQKTCSIFLAKKTVSPPLGLPETLRRMRTRALPTQARPLSAMCVTSVDARAKNN